VFVTKVNAAGTGLVYSGYIGGDEQEEGIDIAVDDAGHAYVTGYTISTDATFPAIVGPDLTSNGASDAFVAKVNPAGTGLVYSGFIGGSGNDSAIGLALDGAGNAYVTGGTESDETTFPVVGGPDLTFNGYVDAFVVKVNPSGTELIYAGYLGGTNDELAQGIAVDGVGSAYVVGYTESDESSFPVTAGPDLTFNGGGDDGFVARLNPGGTKLIYAGYIGGGDTDRGSTIAVDGVGNAYIVGETESDETTFPVTGGPDLTFNGGGDGFITKIALIDAPQSIMIEGPETGLVGAAYVFTATISPLTTTLPLSYSWQATGQPPVTHTSGLTDTAVFTWTFTGTITITVTAWNSAGSVTNAQTITITTLNFVYLPVALKP
jgi:hypothetical protein